MDFFIHVSNKCVWITCKARDVERNLMAMHKDYISKHPEKSEIRRNKSENLKRNLRSPQAM
jgi:hypothetical protein